jgi:DinB superfamily
MRVALAAAGVSTIVCAAGADTLAAQYLGGGTKSAAEVQIADLESLRDKFIDLAEAFPDTLYDWRPMEGVRSLRDVLALIAAESTLFPTMWDFPGPDWVAEGGIGGELGRLRALEKAELVTELRRSFNHVVTLTRKLPEADRARQVSFFGLHVDLGTALTLMQTDMHEHLGQAIAYARMNHVVPPWSQ